LELRLRGLEIVDVKPEHLAVELRAASQFLVGTAMKSTPPISCSALFMPGAFHMPWRIAIQLRGTPALVEHTANGAQGSTDQSRSHPK
jgi:hypothetical protein